MTYPAIDNLPPIHPGEMLRDDLDALGLSARRFAKHIGVPPNAVTEILNGERGVTAAMALRLAKALGTDDRYWTNLQSLYETKLARAEIGAVLDGIERLPDIGKVA
jgi:addiction module HigA family antidote